MADLHDSHVLSTRFMKSDWLTMKYQDVGVKYKQSHVVKCSVDHQKSSPKTNPHGYSCSAHAHTRDQYTQGIVSMKWFVSNSLHKHEANHQAQSHSLIELNN